MKLFVGTKTKVSTKTAVALIAGAVILAAAAAGAFSTKNGGRGSFFSTQGYGPSASPYLDVRFATRSGYDKAQPGDTGVNFGEYKFKAVGADITVIDFNPMLLVQDAYPSGLFTVGSDSVVVAEDRLTNCLLRDTSTSTVFSGPVFPGSGMSPTHLLMTDDFTISNGQSIRLALECDLTTVPVSGSTDALAINLPFAADVIAKEYPSLTLVPVQLVNTNGNPPSYYVLEL